MKYNPIQFLMSYYRRAVDSCRHYLKAGGLEKKTDISHAQKIIDHTTFRQLLDYYHIFEIEKHDYHRARIRSPFEAYLNR